MTEKKVKKGEEKKDNLKVELDSLIAKYNELQKAGESLSGDLAKVRGN